MCKKLLLSFCLFIGTSHLTAQDVILTSRGGSFYSLDITSCAVQELPFPCNVYPNSVALYKDTVYIIAYDRANFHDAIFRSVLGNPFYCEQITIADRANNLTVDSAGVLYWQSTYNYLYSYDPHSATLVNHGYLPFTSAGDLIFYKSQLYLASDYGELVAVDIQHPENSTVYMKTGHGFFGLINIPIGCNQNQVFGLEFDNLIPIDMENKTVGTVYCNLPFPVDDAGSITETGFLKGISVSSVAVHPDCSINGNNGKISVTALTASAGSIDIFINGKPTDNTGRFENLAAGSYNFHLVSQDGCTADTMVILQKNSPVSLLIMSLPDSCNAATGSITVTPAADYGPLVYYFNNAILNSNFYDHLKQGVYKVSAEDTNHCRVDSSIAIKNITPPSPVTSIEVTNATCQKGSGEITVYAGNTPALRYSLNTMPPQPSGLFKGLDTGLYQLQVTTTRCVFDTMVIVPLQPLVKPSIVFTASPPLCLDKNGLLQFNLTGGLPPFSISIDNAGYTSNNMFANVGAGSHLITVRDANSCLWDTTAVIPPNTLLKPDVHYSIKNPQCFSSSPGVATVEISGTENPYSFSLNRRFYPSGASVSHLSPGNYPVTIFNKSQCAVDSFMVSLVSENNGTDCDTLFVPRAFTPNNDGLNDLIKPTISNFPSHIVFTVFNRFGENIFSTTKTSDGWNGMYKGIPQPVDSYIWVCSYVTASGVTKLAKGVFVLIR